MKSHIHQIETRGKNDSEIFSDALGELASVLNAEFLKEHPAEEVNRVMSVIFKSIGLKVPEIPEDILDKDEQLDFLLQATPAMHRRIELKGKWWRHSDGSMLGTTTDGELIAITRAGLSGYRYTDKKGNTVKINKRTAAQIRSDAFCFYRPFPEKELKFRDLGAFILKTISFSDIAAILILSLGVSLIGMATPRLNNFIFDKMIPGAQMSKFLPLISVFFGLAVGTAMFSLTQNVLLSRFSNKIDLSVQSAVMMRLFSLPARFFKDYSAGELSSRAASVTALCKNLSVDVLTVSLTALFSFVYIFQMVKYAKALVIPALISIIALLAFSIAVTIKSVGISRKLMKEDAKLSGLTFQLFSGISKIRLSGAEKRAFAKWGELYTKTAKLNYTPPQILRLSSPISTLISMCGTMIMLYFAGATRVSVADFMAFSAAFGSVNAAAMGLIKVVSTFASIGPTMEMVQPILETIPEGVSVGGDKKTVTGLSGDIEISHVTFQYDKDGPVILNDLSLEVNSGEYVAIVGKTGCGKSTLLRVLLGFEKADTGSVYYDGNDIQSLNLMSLRQNIGVCLQNGQLFSGDIFSNIIISSPEKTVSDAWEAAEMAGVKGDIEAMPMGMQTMLSESGGVSGGQKQRILIARAVVGKPKILFFDEATSALDNVTQKHVSDSISALRCTRLVIAHRLSTIKDADRIVLIEDGKIAEDGTYDDLIALDGKFADLVRRQRVDV